MARTRRLMARNSKKGLMEGYLGQLILLVVFLLVIIIIYAILSGKFSQAGTGMQWLT